MNSNKTQQRELNEQQDHKEAPTTSIEHNMEAMTTNTKNQSKKKTTLKHTNNH